MLFDIITIVLILVLTICFLRLFKMQSSTPESQRTKSQVKSVIKKHSAKVEESTELKRLNDLLLNIDTYTGSSEGQKKIR